MISKQEVKIREANETEVAAIDRSPAGMIIAAIGKGDKQVDLAQLKDLLAMQRDWESNEARKIFAISFANAQANIEAVIKTKVNPQTHSKYADLGDIIENVKPIYTAEGFSVIFYEGVTTVPENIRVCVDVLHKAGHKESYFYDVPLDGTGLKGNANMTKIHGKSSSVSYARRYLMCMIWNIPTQDDDGNGANQKLETITKEQLSALLDIVDNNNFPKAKFLTFCKIDDFANLPVKDFQKTLVAAQNIAKTGNPA